MRQIKFRAWYEKSSFGVEPGMYLDVQDSYDTLDGNPFQSFKGIIADCRDGESVLEQFTGLKDKNGKEIYEGDILAVADTHPQGGYAGLADKTEPPEPFNHIEVVRFENGCFQALKMTFDQLLDEYGVSALEIIGNIHENPDLLIPDAPKDLS